MSVPWDGTPHAIFPKEEELEFNEDDAAAESLGEFMTSSEFYCVVTGNLEDPGIMRFLREQDDMADSPWNDTHEFDTWTHYGRWGRAENPDREYVPHTTWLEKVLCSVEESYAKALRSEMYHGNLEPVTGRMRDYIAGLMFEDNWRIKDIRAFLEQYKDLPEYWEDDEHPDVRLSVDNSVLNEYEDEEDDDA
jgi:hypothetical protein